MKQAGRYDYKARRLALKQALGADDEEAAITRLYVEEMRSAPEISEMLEGLGVTLTPRSIQRILRKHGAARGVGDAFRLAAKRGRIEWAYKDPLLKARKNFISKGLRFSILERDEFRCVLCGVDAKSARLEVDHIVPLVNGGNDKPENLRTLCHDCNVGKRIHKRER